MSRTLILAIIGALIACIMIATAAPQTPTAMVNGDRIAFSGKGSVTFTATYPVCRGTGGTMTEIVSMKGSYPITAFYYPSAVYCLGGTCRTGMEWGGS